MVPCAILLSLRLLADQNIHVSFSCYGCEQRVIALMHEELECSTADSLVRHSNGMVITGFEGLVRLINDALKFVSKKH
jgi:hypothetical protein